MGASGMNVFRCKRNCFYLPSVFPLYQCMCFGFCNPLHFLSSFVGALYWTIFDFNFCHGLKFEGLYLQIFF